MAAVLQLTSRSHRNQKLHLTSYVDLTSGITLEKYGEISLTMTQHLFNFFNITIIHLL